MWATRYVVRRLAAWVEATTGWVCVGPDAQTVRPPRPYLGLSWLTFVERPLSETSYSALPTVCAFDFSAVTVADRAAVRVGDEVVVVGPGLAPTGARDAALAALEARYMSADAWVAFAADGAARLVASAGPGWAPPACAALQGATLDVVTAEACRVRSAPVDASLSLQVYSEPSTTDAVPPLYNALQRLARLRHAAYSEDPEDVLARPPLLRLVSDTEVVALADGPRTETRPVVTVAVTVPGGSRHSLVALAGAPLSLRLPGP